MKFRIEFFVKNLFFGFLLITVFFSCTEEENNEVIDLESHGVIKVELRDLSTDQNYNHGDFETPSNELLSDVFDLMGTQSWWSDFVTYIESNNYSIRGNFATIDKMGTDDYVIFIPIKDVNNQLVSLVKYSTAGDHAHFSHKSVRKILLVAEEANITDIPEEYISYILKLAVYQHYLYDGASSTLISALTKYIEANPDKIYTRQMTEYYWIKWSNLVEGGEDVYAIQIQVISDCNADDVDGSPTGGGPIIDDVDDLTGGDPPTKNPLKNILDKYPSLIALDSCLLTQTSSDLISFLKNGIEDLQCTTISEEDLYDAIKALCDEHSESISFSAFEGNNSAGASFSLKDLNELLPDYIDLSVLERDCPCLYDYFTKLSGTENKNWLCNILNEMNDTDAGSFLQDFELTNEKKFRTIPGWESGTATMLIPKEACNGTSNNDGFPDIDSNSLIGAQFIHEFFHSYLVYLWSKDNSGPVPDDFYIYDDTTTTESGSIIISGTPNLDYYIELVESFAEGEVITGDQHVLFFTHLKNLITNALYQLSGAPDNQSPSDYEYYFHLLVNTPDLVEDHPTFAQNAGFVDENGNKAFDISDYLEAWKSVGGSENGSHALFDPNC